MRFFERLTTLIRADAHGVIDQLEERGLLLRQHLREAELELDRKRARAAALLDEERRVSDAVRRLTQEVAECDNDVELALSNQDEELARFSIRRLLPKRAQLEALARRSNEIDEERTRLGECLATQESQFQELQQRVRVTLVETQRREESAGDWESVVAEQEVSLELMRRRAAGLAGGA